MATVDDQLPAPDELRGMFHGSVVLTGDPDYDEARSVWNGMIDRRPFAIVRAADLYDIRAAIGIARDRGLPLAIRGGAHNVAGNATVDAGLVLDLGGLKAIDVDPDARTVRVDPGVTLGDIDRATEPHGLAVPMGVVSQTGIAGLTLGGGFGWLVRAHGLTVDNLIAADVMTASGELVHTDETERSDLFWGLKGGGGNFGVVTSFTFRAHPLGPKIFSGNLIYELPRWREALVAWRTWTADLDDRMTSIISFLVPPPEFELGDRVLMLLGFAWSGTDHGEGARILSALRTVAPADTELVEPARWVDWQSAADSILTKGVRAYWKNSFIQTLDERMIDTLIEHAGAQTWIGTGTDLHHMGGAFSRVPEAATPFPNRSANYWLNIYGFWADATDDVHHIGWVRALHGATTRYSMAGTYVNALAQDGDRADPRQLAEAAYGREKLERLITLKRKYDPGNVFRLNHNIPPD